MSSRLFPTFLISAAVAITASAAENPAPPELHLPSISTPPSASGAVASPPLAAYTAVGASFAKSSRLGELGWTEREFNAFVEGVRLAYRGQPVPPAEGTEQLYALMARRVAEIEAKERERVFADPDWLERYMKDACKKFSLQRSDSGLAYAVVSKGKGVRPGPDDSVVVSVKVTAPDGSTELPSLSFEKQRVKVGELVPGLAEGVQMMTLDSRGLFVLPPALSYGDREWPRGIVRGSPLLFVIQLHEVIPGEPAP